MLANYLKIALRNNFNHKGYSLINVIGLSIGLAAAIIIGLYVQHELSFEKFYPDSERIYRVCMGKRTEARDTGFAGCSKPALDAITADYPQVEVAARFGPCRPYAAVYQDRSFFEEKLNYTDANFFKMFGIDFLRGSSENALNQVNTAVITEEMAAKYFGAEDPLGKVINVNAKDYEIIGLIENPPSNTHLQYGILLSMRTQIEAAEAEWGRAFLEAWDGGLHASFIKLAEGTDPVEFEGLISDIAHRYIGDDLAAKNVVLHHFLQPLESIYLHSDLTWENGPRGNMVNIYIFSIVGALILLLASINYINLSTARFANRSSEIGIRKVNGALRKQIFSQFIFESFIMTAAAMIFAVVIVEMALPAIMNLTANQVYFASLNQLSQVMLLILLTLTVALLSGSYPAVLLSGFKPMLLLKSRLRLGSKSLFTQKMLVISQFVITVTLIIGAVILFKQLNFMKNYPLGFDKEQKLIVSLDTQSVNPDNYEAIKGEFLSNPHITGATVSSSVPGRWMYFWRTFPYGQEVEKNLAMNFFQFDYDFLPQYGIKFIAGRAFDKDISTDHRAYIINKAAALAYGWEPAESAAGKLIGRRSIPVIGVTENFHFRGLQEEVAPVVMFLICEDYKYLSLTVDTENLNGTLKFVEQKQRELQPGKPLDYFFLDDDFNRQYNTEAQLSKLVGIFTLIALSIACLGIIGLASYMTENRTKEIGVRKVLGATVMDISVLISREFIITVIIANIIAWPITCYAADKWLQGFACRTGIEAWVFVLAAILSISLALITTSFQSLKAAMADPVDSLRHE